MRTHPRRSSVGRLRGLMLALALLLPLLNLAATPAQAASGDCTTSGTSTVRMHRKLRAAGVAAELHVFEALPHGGFGGMAPEDLELQGELRRFLNRIRRST